MAVATKTYPTVNMLELMVIIYERKHINFSEQNIYKDDQFFRKQMQKMINARWAKKISGFNGDMRTQNETFILTLRGKLIVENVLIDYDRRNSEPDTDAKEETDKHI